MLAIICVLNISVQSFIFAVNIYNGRLCCSFSSCHWTLKKTGYPNVLLAVSNDAAETKNLLKASTNLVQSMTSDNLYDFTCILIKQHFSGGFVRGRIFNRINSELIFHVQVSLSLGRQVRCLSA